jgi:hypothetical protein
MKVRGENTTGEDAPPVRILNELQMPNYGEIQGWKATIAFSRLFSVSLNHRSSIVKWTSFISLISVITIACVPVRSNTVPLARTYLPTNGISCCR